MVKKLEVIDYFDEYNRSLVHRVPSQGSADIAMGAQLLVQENQEAIFFRDGKALDVFGPGRHTLTTANIPLLTRILTIPWEKSPFQAQVYFFGKQTFINQKWGTRQPILFKDSQFGMLRLRSFGKYSFRICDAKVLLSTLVGTQGKYTTDEISIFLRDLIAARLNDLMGTLGTNILDLPGKYDEVAAGVRAKVAEEFTKYGLELVDFFINAITPPEEVQKAIDARSAMSAVGDLNAFMKFQAAQSMSNLAKQGGGGNASGAMGMGMGAGFGMMMPGLIQQSMAGGAAPPSGGSQSPSPAPAVAAGAAAAAFDFDSLAAVKSDARAIVRSVAQAAGYAIEENNDTWHVTVPIGSLRKQVVVCQFGSKDSQGHEVFKLRSICGPSTPNNAMKLLKYNNRLVHGAFAVDDIEGQPMVILQANQLAETADPLEVSRLLTAIAWQADKVEEKLLGTDEH